MRTSKIKFLHIFPPQKLIMFNIKSPLKFVYQIYFMSTDYSTIYLNKTEESFSGFFFFFKVHIFWEGHKILRNLPLTFDCMYCSKILWPSQNIWTLLLWEIFWRGRWQTTLTKFCPLLTTWHICEGSPLLS